MNYYKSSQPIPGKGDAVVYYECDDDDTIQRHVTHIAATGETERVPDPIVKKLYRRELLQGSSEKEFKQYWGEA
jgi:hypothetical protein